MSYRGLSVLTGGTVCCFGLLLASSAQAQVTCGQAVGPDVIVGDIIGNNTQFSDYNANYNVDGAYDAFAFGTTSCNVGNQTLLWRSFSSSPTSQNNRHPAIAQSMYRFKTVDGATRFEMIGQSWLKHGFAALAQNLCCGCNNPGTQQLLGVGCSDPYTAQRNGSQSGGLGPKWQVDATTGWFPNSTIAQPTPLTSSMRRLRVALADLEPSSAAVKFFVESQYVSQDDAAFGNKNNNASYRELTVTQGTATQGFIAVGASTTQRGQPAIMAWKALDPAVVIANVETPESPNSDYGAARTNAYSQACCTTGLVIVGARATDLGDGTWHYEYAVQNLNSDRSIASFSIPVPKGVEVTRIEFHDVDYHSGDAEGNFSSTAINRDGTDWPATIAGGMVKWETTPFAVNANANALRWGTTYNFRFNANVAPVNGVASLGTWKVPTVLGTPGTIPVPGPLPTNTCGPDIAPPGGDTVVGVPDLLAVIAAWGGCGSPCPADINGDLSVGVPDLLAVISAWGPCPK